MHNFLLKNLLLLSIAVLFFPRSSQNQVRNNWVVKKPFEQKVFIENNEGQFDGSTGKSSDKILFSSSIDGLNLFFTPEGVIYRSCKFNCIRNEQKEETEKRGVEHDLPKPINYFFSQKWSGINHGVEVIAENAMSFYYTYPINIKHTVIAHAFKKLLYKNIYPNIDVEYSFPENKNGLEYTVIVRPGADLADVRLDYENAKDMRQDSNGNILLQSSFGIFIEHTPEKTWYKETDEQVKTTFQLSRNEIVFNVDNYDKTKTLIIDPWTTNPGFTSYDAGYELRYDLKGNIFVYGGGNTSSYTGPFQLIKIGPTGSVSWILSNAGGWLGDVAVDEKSGKSYIGTAQSVWEVSPAGTVISAYNIQNGGPMYELWKMNFDNCNNKIIIAGGGGAGAQQAAIIDTDLSGLNNFDVLGTTEENHDMTMLATDEANGFCYMATMHSLSAYSSFDNVLVKCPIPAITPATYIVQDGFAFDELHSIAYVDDQVYFANGYNGMAVSPNWLYLYDGSMLKRFDKNTGNVNATLNVSTPVYSGSGHILTYWGGIDVDFCDNVYLGHGAEIDIYDASFNHSGTISMAANTDTVYDVRLGSNNMLYACGKGFVASFNVPNPTLNFTKKSSPACSGCTGTALIYSSGCNSNNLNYSWSNGSTTQYLTGLCPGTYTVTVSYGCESLFTDTVQVKNSASPSVNVPTTNIINVSCFNGNNGSAIANASFGTPPYTYQWFPAGQTGQKDSNMIQGTYTVMVKDSNGCESINTATVSQPSQLTVSTTPEISIEAGQSATLIATANGGTPQYTYQWIGGNNGPGTVVAPNVTTTYSVIVTDSNGCTAIASVTVDVLCGELFVPNAFSPNGDGQNDKLYVRDNCIQSIDFMIFDRWGNKVYETENINDGWDGIFKGQSMNAGTYVWYLKATMYDGSTVEKKGNTSLIR